MCAHEPPLMNHSMPCRDKDMGCAVHVTSTPLVNDVPIPDDVEGSLRRPQVPVVITEPSRSQTEPGSKLPLAQAPWEHEGNGA